MRITTIVPCYNAASTLSLALASVAAQTRASDEVIVVDDASSDETLLRARALCDGRQGWQVVESTTNGGPAAARNRGLAQATGDWIAFLDADDTWVPWRLALQERIVREGFDGVLVCGKTLPLESGGESDALPEPGLPVKGRALQLEELGFHNPIATSTVLARHETIRALGGFDEIFRGPEDYELWIRAAVRGSVCWVDAPLAYYRCEPGSLSMDERRFLPQVCNVLQKAYGAGGSLEGRTGYRRALGYQHLAAAWMAYERGAATRAWDLLIRSVRLWPWRYPRRYVGSRYPRLRLVKRFLSGGSTLSRRSG